MGSVTPSVSAVRSKVLVLGYEVRAEEWTVEQNGYSAADSFSLVLPFFVQVEKSADPVLVSNPQLASALVTTDSLPVQISVAQPDGSGGSPTVIMDGVSDTVEWNFDSAGGATVTLTGRNQTGKMLDTKITDKFPNLTASAIAARFAAEHGLAAVVTATTQLAGTYYDKQTALLGNETSQWDLLLFLAARENFICRVKNGKLFFGPYETVMGGATPVRFSWLKNAERIRIERSPHAARNIVVTVLSYERGKKQRIVEVARSNTQSAQGIRGQHAQRSEYKLTYSIPGLTRQQAQKRARQIYEQLSRSQVIGQLVSAGNTGIAIDGKLDLSGVGPGLEASYYVNRISHRFSLSGGYGVEIAFSTETDYSKSLVAEQNADAGQLMGGSASSLAGAAALMNGRTFWRNSCAYAVNQVLKASGIDISRQVGGNPNWVPNYANLGQRITSISDLRPGDLVIYPGYQHIGIYAGNGEAWNVSSSAGYKWIKNSIWGFKEGRRITSGQ